MPAKNSINALIKKPSAWIPLLAPILFIAIILAYTATFGITENEDEGIPARLFQIAMIIQALAILLFTINWLPKAPKQALAILFLQVILTIVPIMLINFLEN